MPIQREIVQTHARGSHPHYAGENIRFDFYHQVQPCVASGIMHETSLAVVEVCGEEAFWQFSKELFEKREFTDIYTFDATRHELTEDILNQCHRSKRRDV